MLRIKANRDARAGNVKLTALQLVSRELLRCFVIYVGDVVAVKNRRDTGIIQLSVEYPAFGDTSKLSQPGIVFCQGITTT